MGKKILFVVNVDWYFNLHWKERIYSEMTNDFEVTVSYTQTKEEASGASRQVIPLKIQRSSINPLSNLISLIKAAIIIHRQDFDLIHSATVKPNLYFGLLTRLYDIPIILTIPGLGTIFSSNGLKYKLLRKFIRFGYCFAGKNKKSYFVFENKQDRNHFLNKKICSRANSTVVFGAGVDLEKFRYNENTAPSSHPVKILFAARLLKGKGLEELIQATGVVNATGKRVDLSVAGIVDKDSRGVIPLSQIKKWHNNGQINYLGQVDDMPELLSKSHIVALPTTYGEGLPRILLEANACGLPVITTNIAGCNDFVEDGLNGLLVTPGRTDELVEAIEKLLEPKYRIQMGRAGRKKVEEKYSKEHVISQYRVVYKSLTVNP